MMSGWDWLEKQDYTPGFGLRVVIKAAVLFVILNALFALLNPLPVIGNLTIYNTLVNGRDRLPYGEDPAAYNLSLNSLEAMFSSHKLAQAKAPDEFRVLVAGDSSVWGILLRPEETLTGYLNVAGLRLSDGREIRTYNIGHPIMSVTKDLMLLDHAMQYEPDLIVWLTTLESFPQTEQLEPPIVQNNAPRVRDLIQRYDLALDDDDSRFVDPDWLDRTIVGQRRPIADWLRLQLYGVMWQQTGIDQVYNPDYTPRSNDFDGDISWYDFDTPQDFGADDLAFDVIEAGHALAGEVPVLLVNEPIFIADGRNSDLRYNFWYPQWAYDSYRDLYADLAESNGWQYMDLWNLVAPENFTDSPVHLTPQGSEELADAVGQAILDVIDDE